RDTSHRGTNVIRPNHATLRSAITPSRSAIADVSSWPAAARAAPAAGTKLRRYEAPTVRASATANPGTASRRPPRSPKARTRAVVARGPIPKPRLPPIENHDIRLARFRPLTKPANVERAGR